MSITGPIPQHIAEKMSPEDRRQFGKAGRTWEEAEAARFAIGEKELQRMIMAYLKMRDIFPICSGMHKSTSTPCGTPDFLLAVKGKAVAFEVKSATGTLSEDQEFVRRQLEANGWRYVVVQSVGQVKEVVDDLMTA